MRMRRALADEADAVVGVWQRARIASIPEIPRPAHSELEVLEWFRHIVLPTQEVWVADDGEVVAVLVLQDEWIEQLYVDPGHTDRGIGSRLVALAKGERPSGLKLWTFETNVRARRFYERHGFIATGSSAGDNEEGAPDIRYEWSPSVGE